MRHQNEELEEIEGDPRGGLIRILTIIAVGLIGGGPLILVYAYQFWSQSEFRVFPLAMAGSLYLYWRAWREAERPPTQGSAWITIPGSAFGFYLLMIAIQESRLGLGYGVMIFGIVLLFLHIGGWRFFFQSIPGTIMALIFSTPILHVTNKALSAIYDLTLEISCLALSVFRVPNVIYINAIKIPSDQWLSLPPERFAFTLSVALVLAVFYVLVRRRPVFFLPIVAVGTFAAQMLISAAQVIISGILQFHGEQVPFLLQKPWGELIVFGLVLFLGIWLSDALLANRFIRQWEVMESPIKHPEPLLARTNFGFRSKILAILLVVLGLLQVYTFSKQYKAQLKSLLISACSAPSGAPPKIREILWLPQNIDQI